MQKNFTFNDTGSSREGNRNGNSNNNGGGNGNGGGVDPTHRSTILEITANNRVSPSNFEQAVRDNSNKNFNDDSNDQDDNNNGRSNNNTPSITPK